MALIAVDIQNDFCSGGALEVPEAEQVLEPANALIDHFHRKGLPVYISRDWHPQNHTSFVEYGGPWPPHCVQDTWGAEFHPDLHIPQAAQIISKATHPAQDSYSDFDGTGLADMLRQQDVDTILVLGLATDYCVLATVSDGLEAGFRAIVVPEAVRAVNVEPDDGEKAVAKMERSGARFVPINDLIAYRN